MKRILIIGSSGAGKTTLAKELSRRLDIPHTELDSIYHQDNWQPLDTETFRKRVYELSDKDEWIFCGDYFSKLGLDLWHRADTVIWCDYSFPLVFSRLFRRTLIRGAYKAPLWNGNRESLYVNFLTKDSLLLWMMKTWNKRKRRYSKLFNEPENFPDTQLIHLKNPKQTLKFLRSVHSP